MIQGLVSGFSSITKGDFQVLKATLNKENTEFQDLVNRLKSEKKEHKNFVSSSQILANGKINGDVRSSFHGFSTDKNALPKGAALNQSGVHGEKRTIDKTSALYEKSMELECFFVKQVLQSMKNTVHKSGLFKNDFAGKMYEDMLYDEYAVNFTKNAGLGLADQIYLSLEK